MIRILHTVIVAAVLIGCFWAWISFFQYRPQWPSWETGPKNVQDGESDSNFAHKVMEGSLHRIASVAAGTGVENILPDSLSKKKVVMVTGSSGTNRMLGMPHIKEMIYENRKTYAEKHGFKFMWANMTSYNLPNGAAIYWNKIPILKEAFERHPDAEWVWWMDMDIIIMNTTLNIYDHILSKEGLAHNILLDREMTGAGGGKSGFSTPATYKHNDINFVISLDSWGMNVGNFLIRRGEWSKWLLDLWVEPLYISQNWVFPENDAWTHMWEYHGIVRDHAAITTQRSMNAYPDSNMIGEHWQPGDHIVHFAGCGGDVTCEEKWNKYWDMREKVEVPISVRQKLEDGTAEIENVQAGVGLQ
ncbi:hypothetical protein N7526_008602 [Penicillium atrosanguineum]|nr:hypothetical protein N7526_008602 [Penicillium atrosanguineum]